MQRGRCERGGESEGEAGGAHGSKSGPNF
jgi:hypothetical protein